MSAGVLDDIIGSSEALIAALDSDNVDNVEAALPAFGRSVEILRTGGDWKQSPDLRARVEQAASLVEAALFKARYLGDRSRQQLDMLATAAGRFDCTPATYARDGR